MRTLYRIILGLVPALPIFYLAYLGTNLIMEFVVVFTELVEVYWGTRDFAVFKDFSMEWNSAFIVRTEFQLIYIFIGLVVLYKYVEWYYGYVTKPVRDKKARRREKRTKEIGKKLGENSGINKEVGKEEVTNYRKIEAIRVEEDVESKEIMREILEAVKPKKEIVEELSDKVEPEKVEEVETPPETTISIEEMVEKQKEEKVKEEVDDMFEELGFESMVSDKKAKEMVGKSKENEVEELELKVIGKRNV